MIKSFNRKSKIKKLIEFVKGQTSKTNILVVNTTDSVNAVEFILDIECRFVQRSRLKFVNVDGDPIVLLYSLDGLANLIQNKNFGKNNINNISDMFFVECAVEDYHVLRDWRIYEHFFTVFISKKENDVILLSEEKHVKIVFN